MIRQHIAPHVDRAVEESSTLLAEALLSDPSLRKQIKLYALQNLALECSGFNNRTELEALEDTNDSHPKVQLYYASLSLLYTKLLTRTADKQSY